MMEDQQNQPVKAHQEGGIVTPKQIKQIPLNMSIGTDLDNLKSDDKKE